MIQGRIFRDPALPNLSPKERRDIYTAMTATLALLHSLDWKKLSLETFGKPGNYYERQVSRSRIINKSIFFYYNFNISSANVMMLLNS